MKRGQNYVTRRKREAKMWVRQKGSIFIEPEKGEKQKAKPNGRNAAHCCYILKCLIILGVLAII